MQRRFTFTLNLLPHETYEGDLMYKWVVPKSDGTVWKAEIARVAQDAAETVRRKAQSYHP